MLNFYEKKATVQKKFTDYSNPTGLDHGEGYVQQNLHFLLHQADRARELYGAESIEYDSLVTRLANQLIKYGRGGNFTIDELQHYNREHHQSMEKAGGIMKEVTGIPLVNYFQGYNWTVVTPNLGNAEGDGFIDTPSRTSNNYTPSMMGKPRVKYPGTPSTYDGNKRLSTTKPYVGGLEVYTQHLASKAVRKK